MRALSSEFIGPSALNKLLMCPKGVLWPQMSEIRCAVSFIRSTICTHVQAQLGCNKLSVECERAEQQCASVVQHQLPEYPSIPARLVSPEQSRKDYNSGAVQMLTKRCRDTEPTCPDQRIEFGHAVRESRNEDTSLVDEPELSLIHI